MKIDIVEKVELNGLKQKIHILGENENNPVILMLHGGPGISNRHSVVKREIDLCNDFTIVAWDQRGTGGSYKGCKVETLTLDMLVSDSAELCKYLCKKLNQKKIFIIGGSWGTELGTFLSFRHPELIAGYIGYGQVVNGAENERISWEFCVEEAKKANDEESLKILNEVGPPVKGQYKPDSFSGMMKQRKILNKYGGHNVAKKGYWESTVKPMLLSKEYTLSDKIGLIKGYKFVLSNMWGSICDYDFKYDCNKFEMPYYIFQGKLDKNTPSDLVEDFFNAITAPDKDLVWFEHSAHGPLGEEPEKFKKLIREKFLKIAKTL